MKTARRNKVRHPRKANRARIYWLFILAVSSAIAILVVLAKNSEPQTIDTYEARQQSESAAGIEVKKRIPDASKLPDLPDGTPPKSPESILPQLERDGLDVAEEIAAENATLRLSTATTWGRAETLADHFARHGADFGAKTANEYASMASRFLQEAQTAKLPTKIDSQGVIRIFDPKTGAFGAFNPNGTTRTFFKPNSPTYFERQPGSLHPW